MHKSSLVSAIHSVLAFMVMIGMAYCLAWGIEHEQWLYAAISIAITAVVFADVIRVAIKSNASAENPFGMEM